MPYFPPSSTVSFGNPTALVGLTAVNGSATTAMRSDAAPALDQTAAYTFSGLGATTISAAASSSVVPLKITALGAANAPVVMLGSQVGLYVRAGNALDLTDGTNPFMDFQAGGIAMRSSSNLGWVSGTDVTASPQTRLLSPGAATLQLGVNSATPINQTFQGSGSRPGTDSNVAGAKLSINPGAGTGNAAPNPLQLNSYVAVASGSTVQTLTNTITLNSGLVQFNTYTTAGIIVNDASGNLTSNSTVVASTIPANFLAADRLTVVINGTTYYIPLATVAF